MPALQTRQELLAIVQQSGLGCVDRGKAIVELVESGMTQVAIADSTTSSTVAISHLRTCFDNLRGEARAMCKDRKMNADACYRLASAPPALDQERIPRCAITIRSEKDAQRRSELRVGPRGRQTLEGRITDGDIKEAITRVRYDADRVATATV
jgi:hypothetical protein